MPKKLKVHPNERVDIPDFIRAANEYTDESEDFAVERTILDRRARLLEGFRVEVLDQTAAPGRIKIHNGNAFARDGEHLNIESSPDIAQVLTLAGATQDFFIEIEFTPDEKSVSDPDSRTFWDATIDNPEPIPDGREFDETVATRITPGWSIVKPVLSFAAGTGAFTVDSDPNTTKIPLIKLQTDGVNRILPGDNPGLVLVEPASVLTEDAANGASTIRVASARIFPGAGAQIFLDPAGVNEAVTITSVDRVNDTIDFAPGIAAGAGIQAGKIVRADVTASFVEQRVDPKFDLAAHPDRAERIYQGDELRGSGLLASKETDGERDELNLRSLKDYIDYLSAQLREVKYGHPRVDVNGSQLERAPAFDYTGDLRYFDDVGGLLGARTASVTIGDGSTSFGDFNGTNSAPFQNAVDSLPSVGGTIFIKPGTYTLNSEVNYSGKTVNWIGDSVDLVTLLFDSDGQSMFDVTTAGQTVFKNLTLTKSGDNQRVIRLEDITSTRIEQCVIVGEIRTLNPVAVDAKLTILDSTVTALDAADRRAVRAEDLKDIVVDNCFITGEFHVINPVLVHRFDTRHSTFVAAPQPNTSAIRIGDGALFNALNCVISANIPATDQRVIRFEGTASGSITDCVMVTADGALFEFDDAVTSFAIKNSQMITLLGGALINSTDTGAGWSSVVFDGITIGNPTGATLNADNYMLFGTLTNCSFKNILVSDPLVASVPTDSFIRWGDSDTSSSIQFLNQVTFENIQVLFDDPAGGVGLNCLGDDSHAVKYAVHVSRCSFFGCTTAIQCRKPGSLVVDDVNIQGGDLAGQGSQGVVCGPRRTNTTQAITVRNSTIERLVSTAVTSAFGIHLVGPDAAPSPPPDNMFASLTIENNYFSVIGNALAHDGTVAGIFAEEAARTSHVVISGNEFDRLDALSGASTVLRSILIKSDTMSGEFITNPHNTNSTFIFDNNFHDQGHLDPSIDNGFVEIDAANEDSRVTNCKINDNTLSNLLGADAGLFGIRLTGEGILRSSICRNTLTGIGQNGLDDSGTSGCIHMLTTLLLDMVISENTVNQVLSSIPAIRIAPTTSLSMFNVVVNNNTVFCGPPTWRPIYIGAASSAFGTTISGNVITSMAQIFSALPDAGILLLAGTLTNTIVSNNNIGEFVFLQSRSAIKINVTGSTSLNCSNNVIKMPDPGVGNTRDIVLDLGPNHTHFMVSNNMLRISDDPPDGTNSLGIGITGGSDFGMIVGNMVTPGVGGAEIDFELAGDNVLALANLVGTVDTTGTILAPSVGSAKTAALLVNLGVTNVSDMTLA